MCAHIRQQQLYCLLCFFFFKVEVRKKPWYEAIIVSGAIQQTLPNQGAFSVCSFVLTITQLERRKRLKGVPSVN